MQIILWLTEGSLVRHKADCVYLVSHILLRR